MRLRSLILVALATAGCGGSDEPATVTETKTVEAAAPPTAEKSTEKARPKPDPAEQRNELFLAVDDQALAADTAIGFALDGQENAIDTLRRIRKRLLDKQVKLLAIDDSLDQEMNRLIGAVTDARVAAEAGATRQLIEARVATQDARLALTKAALGR